jgi:hypothetical protein
LPGTPPGQSVAGSVLSLIDLGAKSPLVFQGTADDARTLLIGITGTMVTVIALLLGLTVVALQLSSTQFSPRLLRNFLRDRPNQIVLSVFVGTFAYSAAGLYTVGVSAGTRSTDFPRLAVAGALVLLFASLAMLVYFADHLAHLLGWTTTDPFVLHQYRRPSSVPPIPAGRPPQATSRVVGQRGHGHPQLGGEAWQLLARGRVQDLQVDGPVSVDDPVSQTRGLLPRNGRELLPQLR